jgi:hypothetical protein
VITAPICTYLHILFALLAINTFKKYIAFNLNSETSIFKKVFIHNTGCKKRGAELGV